MTGNMPACQHACMRNEMQKSWMQHTDVHTQSAAIEGSSFPCAQFVALQFSSLQVEDANSDDPALLPRFAELLQCTGAAVEPAVHRPTGTSLPTGSAAAAGPPLSVGLLPPGSTADPGLPIHVGPHAGISHPTGPPPGALIISAAAPLLQAAPLPPIMAMPPLQQQQEQQAMPRTSPTHMAMQPPILRETPACDAHYSSRQQYPLLHRQLQLLQQQPQHGHPGAPMQAPPLYAPLPSSSGSGSSRIQQSLGLQMPPDQMHQRQ